jgi:hypothetical protein
MGSWAYLTLPQSQPLRDRTLASILAAPWAQAPAGIAAMVVKRVMQGGAR